METIASNEMKTNSNDDLSILQISVPGVNQLISIDLNTKIMIFKSIL